MQPQSPVNIVQRPKQPKAVKITLITAAALWLIACVLVAYHNPADSSYDGLGLACFLVGWLAWMDMQIAAFIAWLSNIPLFIAMILLLTRKYGAAVIYSAVALVGSFGAFFVTNLPKSEGTSERENVIVGPAVFVWIASILTVLIGSIVLNRAAKKNTQSKN